MNVLFSQSAARAARPARPGGAVVVEAKWKVRDKGSRAFFFSWGGGVFPRPPSRALSALCLASLRCDVHCCAARRTRANARANQQGGGDGRPQNTTKPAVTRVRGRRVGPNHPPVTAPPSPHHPPTQPPQAVKLKTKKRPKKITPSDKKHVGATYPPLPPPPPPAYTVLSSQ